MIYTAIQICFIISGPSVSENIEKLPEEFDSKAGIGKFYTYYSMESES